MLIILLLNLNRAGNYGVHDGVCTTPDLTIWLGIGSVLAMAGVGLTVRSVASSGRWRRP